MSQLRAILFDVDDTLYSTTQFAALARRRAVEAMVAQGIDLPVEAVARELSEVISEFTSNYSHHFDKLLLRLPARSWAGINRAILIAAGVTAYHATKTELAPFPDVLPFFAAVSEQTDLLLGIITHGLEIKQAEKLLLLGVVPYVDRRAIFISDQVGIAKPNPKLYTRALEVLELAPDEALYVGDNPMHDIDPANEVGMHTARVHRENRFKGVRGRTDANYDIQSLSDLEGPLERDFGLTIRR